MSVALEMTQLDAIMNDSLLIVSKDKIMDLAKLFLAAASREYFL